MQEEKKIGRPMNYVLMKEVADREWKYFRIYTDFRPDPKTAPLTPKFYSKHDGEETTSVEEEFLELLKRTEQVPRQRATKPETGNQEYGWYYERLMAYEKDRRLDFRRTITPDIKLECEMQREMRKTRSIPKALTKQA